MVLTDLSEQVLMTLMTRMFGSKKPVAPARDRIEHAVAPEHDTPRPLRGASYREARAVNVSGQARVIWQEGSEVGFALV